MRGSVMKKVALHQRSIAWIFLAISILFPIAFSNAYVMRIAIVSLIYVVLTQCINLLGGMVGQLSLGHIAFYGVGAYTCAILSKNHGLPSIVCWVASIVFAGLLGLLLAIPTLRLKGYYFAIVTMGFGEIMRIIEINWMSLTRGPLGISGISKPDFFGFQINTPMRFYYAALIILILNTLLIKKLMDSRHGKAIIAIREDDVAAQSMGINVFRYKSIVFIISAAVTGLMGAFYAQYTSYIDPTAFTSSQSTMLIIMALLGGLGSQVGPFIGAIVLTVCPEVMRFLMEYRMLLYGVVMLFVMLVKPSGLMGNYNLGYMRQRSLFEAEQKKGGRANA